MNVNASSYSLRINASRFVSRVGHDHSNSNIQLAHGFIGFTSIHAAHVHLSYSVGGLDHQTKMIVTFCLASD